MHTFVIIMLLSSIGLVIHMGRCLPRRRMVSGSRGLGGRSGMCRWGGVAGVSGRLCVMVSV